MKELSIEQKAKAYDEAIERAKEQLDGAKVFDYDNEQIAHDIRTTVYNIFPELKEPEDEEVRKAMIDFFKHEREEGIAVLHYGVNIERMIAWLEKQGEKTPAWSEEDDENIMMIENRLSDYLEYIREDSSLTKYRKNTLKEDVIGYFNWIKSLKERYVWKPSKKQMDALDSTLQYSQVSHNSFEQLNSLFNDLKKLRKE